jgi:glucose-1-phosphate cytidylyltransferase
MVMELRSELSKFHASHGGTATLTVTNPVSRFGVVEIDKSSLITSFSEKPRANDLVNIGYFVFEPGIFDYLTNESVLEDAPIKKLVEEKKIGAFKHDGFWKPMDTQREYLELKAIWDSGLAPWKKW